MSRTHPGTLQLQKSKKEKKVKAAIKQQIANSYEIAQPCSNEQMAIFAFLLLPFIFNEDCNVLYKTLQNSALLEELPSNTTSPILVFLGDPLQTEEIYICGEGSILMETSRNTCIRDFFCIFYVCNVEYPKEAVCTFLFVQVHLLKIHHKKNYQQNYLILLKNYSELFG